MATIRSEARLQEGLAEITRLLDRHRVLETLIHRQEGPRRDLLENLQHRQNLAELQKGLRAMHAADVAYALEALPLDDRRTVWEQVPADQAGLVFVEVSDAVRESLVDFTSRDRLVEKSSSRSIRKICGTSRMRCPKRSLPRSRVRWTRGTARRSRTRFATARSASATT